MRFTNIFKKYEDDGANQVLLDKHQKDKLKKLGVKSIEENLIEIKSNYIRHNAKYISNIVVNLALSHKSESSK